MRARHIVFGLAFLASVAASAPIPADPLPRQARQLFAMTPDQFATTAEVKDDALETMATISTMHGWQQHDGLLGMVNDDGFFRAFVDKATGDTHFQVYHMVHYTQPRRARFEIVNYETPAGPVAVPLIRIGRYRGPCRAYAGCAFLETVAFPVDEALLRALAARYVPGRVAVWKYRLKAKTGAERDEGFAAAEIAGLLIAVDRYRAAHGLTDGRGSR
ncbi:hypothetical protein U1872_00925 [Sphingomonas sp. RB3P16]|uniref:hypothetical protein n=1 Tax=Parasphingomonas frigoris TaxID=3096163 RepID=UPI002FC8E338